MFKNQPISYLGLSSQVLKPIAESGLLTVLGNSSTCWHFLSSKVSSFRHFMYCVVRRGKPYSNRAKYQNGNHILTLFIWYIDHLYTDRDSFNQISYCYEHDHRTHIQHSCRLILVCLNNSKHKRQSCLFKFAANPFSNITERLLYAVWHSLSEHM